MKVDSNLLDSKVAFKGGLDLLSREERGRLEDVCRVKKQIVDMQHQRSEG